MGNEKADLLLFISRTILNSQELLESCNVTLEEVSDTVRKTGRCLLCRT